MADIVEVSAEDDELVTAPETYEGFNWPVQDEDEAEVAPVVVSYTNPLTLPWSQDQFGSAAVFRDAAVELVMLASMNADAVEAFLHDLDVLAKHAKASHERAMADRARQIEAAALIEIENRKAERASVEAQMEELRSKAAKLKERLNALQ